MRRPPYFLPRRFLMRLKKNSRNPTNKSGRKGRKSPTTPPKTATKSSIALKKAVETPADELMDAGRRITLSPATRPAIAPPAGLDLGQERVDDVGRQLDDLLDAVVVDLVGVVGGAVVVAVLAAVPNADPSPTAFVHLT